MSEETRRSLQDFYAEIVSSSQHLQDSLLSIAGSFDMRESPSDRAFVSTLQESLGELSVVATMAFERSK